MTIINSNKLTKIQLEDVQILVSLCKLEENLDGILFLESEMNEYGDFPCFYLLYEGSTLISFLSIFIPNTEECELYGYTRPSYRKKGYITSLLDLAKKQLKNYNINSVYLLCEPISRSGLLMLNAFNAQLNTSEYMMKFDIKSKVTPKHILSLKKEINSESEYYKLFLGKKLIGTCNVDQSNFCTTIYNFEIIKKMRGKGYGKESLLLIIENLIEHGYDNIILHLSSDNTIAYNLYTKNGFTIIKQIDYFKKPTLGQ